MKSLAQWVQVLALCLAVTLSAAAQNNAGVDQSVGVAQKDHGIVTIPLGINSTSRAVAMDVRNSREVKIGLVNASVTPFGIPIGAARPVYGGDFNGSGIWYVVSTPDTLYSVDTTSGVFTLLGQITGIPVPAGSNTSGLTWDYSTNTMYMCNLSGGVASLYTLNLATRVATPVGQIIAGTVIDIACSNTGQIYGIKFATGTDPDSLISINKVTGAGTTVGTLGVNVNFAHGLDFDPATDSLFYPGYIGGGVNNLYRINTQTGFATLVGPLAAGEYDCFSVIGSPSTPVPTYDVPEVIYLKFNGGTTTTPNYALPGRGNATATVTGHTIAPGGQFDSTLLGAEGSGATNWADNAWAPDLANGSWTIGFWVSGLHLPTTITSACYLFGDVNTASFRCFWAGAGISPTDTAILLRKAGQPDLRLVLPNPSLGLSSYVHFVYDSVTATLKGYRNGVLGATVTWTSPALTGPGPFKIAGYGTASSSLVSGAKIDEFRVYSRALDTTEIQNTWNRTLPATVTGVRELSNEVPSGFELTQNYPNPFNPTTTIRYGLPTASFVTLKIYNVLGQEIATLMDGGEQSGYFTVEWNGRNQFGSAVASGVYFYRLEARPLNGGKTFANIKKMLMLK